MSLTEYQVCLIMCSTHTSTGRTINRKCREWLMQWAEMLEKEFAAALAVNSELEAAKKASSESQLKTLSTV